MHAWATDHSPSASNRATMQIFLDLFRSGECWPVHPGFQPLVCCSPAGGDWHGQRLSGCHCELEEPLHHGETRCVRPAFSVLKIYKNLPGGRLRCTGAVVSGVRHGVAVVVRIGLATVHQPRPRDLPNLRSDTKATRAWPSAIPRPSTGASVSRTPRYPLCTSAMAP